MLGEHDTNLGNFASLTGWMFLGSCYFYSLCDVKWSLLHIKLL